MCSTKTALKAESRQNDLDENPSRVTHSHPCRRLSGTRYFPPASTMVLMATPLILERVSQMDCDTTPCVTTCRRRRSMRCSSAHCRRNTTRGVCQPCAKPRCHAKRHAAQTRGPALGARGCCRRERKPGRFNDETIMASACTAHWWRAALVLGADTATLRTTQVLLRASRVLG